MGIDIGQALREGASRTTGKNGLVLAIVFAGIALLTTVLANSFFVELVELFLELIQSTSPEELGVSQQEYEQQVQLLSELRSSLTGPTVIGLPISVAFTGIVATAFISEAISVILVRMFSRDDLDTISRDLIIDGILMATLNGFVGKIIVWGLIIATFPLLILPAVFVAVAFYFMRQEIALNNKNFIQAMADSWRITKGSRIEVFLIGAVLVLISQLEPAASAIINSITTIGGAVAGALVGGVLAVFGAAVATRAYVQLDGAGDTVESDSDEEFEDPYDAALGPDDLSR
ncbi:uncharacterized protein Nmlp_1881 [Natronomonas moolapensis 8.8.11]|uniref:DUF7847 domain-containing protein n=1 Tax=Natronomonas moolapensis (strain DSM 18674 / CECT 7526 / JCM 14361 / 8.8.11) TaxID=268739 RepID=M1XPS8_NATM8|nr:hypothetical protein [Natronomonas moolapensis]CCQ36069.1 uncharacterized protein Nmlp_1881 [Natronomonas moolapensis 8.8.11]